MGLLLYAILIYGIFRLARKALQFEKVTRFEQVTLPGYALVMFLLTMNWKLKDIILLIILVIVSAGIGWFQGSQLEVQHTSEQDRHGRPLILVKKNWPYLAGWVAVFVLGIGAEIFEVGQMSDGAIVKSLRAEVQEDLFGFMKFGSNYAWYIWAISAASSLVFAWILRRKDEQIGEAIKRPERHHHRYLDE